MKKLWKVLLIFAALLVVVGATTVFAKGGPPECGTYISYSENQSPTNDWLPDDNITVDFRRHWFFVESYNGWEIRQIKFEGAFNHRETRTYPAGTTVVEESDINVIAIWGYEITLTKACDVPYVLHMNYFVNTCAGYESSWTFILDEGASPSDLTLFRNGVSIPNSSVTHVFFPHGEPNIFTWFWKGDLVWTVDRGVQTLPEYCEPEMCEWNDQLLADDPLCVPPVYGCMDEDALNYNPAATVDDGSCEYEHDWDWGYSCLNEEDCCAGDMMDPQVSAGGTYVTDMPGSPPYPFPYSDDGVQQFYPADAMAGGRYTIQFFWPDGYQTDPMEFYLYEPEDCDSEEKCNSVPVIEYIIQGKQFKCTLYGSAADGDSIYKLPNDVLGWMTDGTCDLQPLECHGECIRSEVLKFERNVSGQFSGKKLNICYETTPWTGCDGELIYPPNPIDNLR